MTQQQLAEEPAEDQMSVEEVVAEYARMRPTLIRMMGEWQRLRGADRGCPVMRHLLDG